MKQFLVVFCAFALTSAFTLLAFNSEEGPAKRRDGIIDKLKQPDSILKRGRQLVNNMNYTKEDVDAIAAYLEASR